MLYVGRSGEMTTKEGGRQASSGRPGSEGADSWRNWDRKGGKEGGEFKITESPGILCNLVVLIKNPVRHVQPRESEQKGETQHQTNYACLVGLGNPDLQEADSAPRSPLGIFWAWEATGTRW